MSAILFRIKQILLQGGVDVSINRYSGRGMMGRNCIGISGSFDDCMQVIGAVIKSTARDAFDKATETTPGDGVNNDAELAFDEVDTNVDLLLSYTRDTLGHQVILYWPELEWPEGEPEYI